MATFYFHFSDGQACSPDDLGIEFESLDRAYLEVCRAIPDLARDLLIKRRDPLAGSCTIADAAGRTLMTVPFTEVLSPSERRSAEVRGVGGSGSYSSPPEAAAYTEIERAHRLFDEVRLEHSYLRDNLDRMRALLTDCPVPRTTHP